MQFRKHTVTRRYLAIVHGKVAPRTIRSTLVRDRGDGRRGSRPGLPSPSGSGVGGEGKEAVTHLAIVETLPGYTLLSCKLETGRTHQIRIHLAELGNPVCGDCVYNRPLGGEPIADTSGAPRLALHAAELGFTHTATDEPMHWEMPPPPDFRELLDRLRQGAAHGD
jgi:23S rRNA pseudouridine1911/1915/1917 synthase